MIWVATANFRSVDLVLTSDHPKAQSEISTLGPDRARALFRYQVSEQNRGYFHRWELAQLALGAALVVVLLASSENRLGVALAGAMVVLVALLHFFITPEVTAIGRAIDFTTLEQMPAERARFWNYHRAYSGLELVKLGLGLALGVRLLWSARRPKLRGSDASLTQQVHPVDHANHTHVDR
jgi:hypothetical protein